MKNYERARFYDVGTQLMTLEVRLAMVGRWFLASVTRWSIVGPAMVWLGGGWLALRGRLDIGVIVAFIGSSRPALRAGAALAGIQVQIVSALAVFERIFDYLDMKTEDYDPPGAVVLSDIQGEVRFDRRHIWLRSDRAVLARRFL